MQLSWKMNYDGDWFVIFVNYEEVLLMYKGVVNGNYQQVGCVIVYLCIFLN